VDIHGLGGRVQVEQTKFIERLSLKGQIIVTLVLIFVSSWAATVVTFGGIVLWARSNGPSYPDLKVQVSRYIADHGTQVLRASDTKTLQHELQGLPYQVVNDQGQVLYGSIHTPILHNRVELIQRINTTVSQEQPSTLLFSILHGTVTQYFPIFDQNGNLHGAFIIRYPVHGIETDRLPAFLSYLIPLIPFLYFCIFTYLFARRFGKRINQPLQRLVKGAQRIQQQDLDFEIEAVGSNEIGQVVLAFENMRVALKEALVQQWQMEEDRRYMISSISHDLRTPLTIIQGHAESLLDGAMANPERLQRYLQTILQNTKRVTQLIEDMQKVTDIDQPGFSLRPLPVNIREFLTERVRDFELMTSQAGIELSVHLEDKREEQAALSIDPERISQILDNIVSNSVRFTPSNGKISIHIEVDKGLFLCRVSDTGPGFSKVDLQHLFDRFYQGDVSRSEVGHSGLGLYTVKTLVEKHGGRITAGNDPTGGAYVQFTIRES
jgi:two-component system, OmpR family, lantibiotic biosynthesis sensor histidine kinase NisK/SpaK